MDVSYVCGLLLNYLRTGTSTLMHLSQGVILKINADVRLRINQT